MPRANWPLPPQPPPQRPSISHAATVPAQAAAETPLCVLARCSQCGMQSATPIDARDVLRALAGAGYDRITLEPNVTLRQWTINPRTGALLCFVCSR
jgi:hypothetical protein